MYFSLSFIVCCLCKVQNISNTWYWFGLLIGEMLLLCVPETCLFHKHPFLCLRSTICQVFRWIRAVCLFKSWFFLSPRQASQNAAELPVSVFQNSGLSVPTITSPTFSSVLGIQLRCLCLQSKSFRD